MGGTGSRSVAATAAALMFACGGALAAEHGAGQMKHGEGHKHEAMGGAKAGKAAAPDTARGQATGDGRFYVVYTPIPDPIPVNRLFRLHLEVFRSAERAQRVSNARVSVDADMPQHGHGMNTAPEVTAGPGGGYLVEGMKFHMPGTPAAPWRMTVKVKAGGHSDRAEFHVVNGQ